MQISRGTSSWSMDEGRVLALTVSYVPESLLICADPPLPPHAPPPPGSDPSSEAQSCPPALWIAGPLDRAGEFQ